MFLLTYLCWKKRVCFFPDVSPATYAILMECAFSESTASSITLHGKFLYVQNETGFNSEVPLAQ